MAPSVKRPTSAQVMILQFMSSSPASGSVLTAQSLEPVSDSVSPSLPLPPKINQLIFKLIYFGERQTDRQSMTRGGAERQGDTESEAGSRL